MSSRFCRRLDRVLAVVCLAFSIYLLRSVDNLADAGLGDGEVCGALGVVAGVVLPEQHLGADTQAIVESGATCAQRLSRGDGIAEIGS